MKFFSGGINRLTIDDHYSVWSISFNDYNEKNNMDFVIYYIIRKTKNEKEFPGATWMLFFLLIQFCENSVKAKTKQRNRSVDWYIWIKELRQQTTTTTDAYAFETEMEIFPILKWILWSWFQQQQKI